MYDVKIAARFNIEVRNKLIDRNILYVRRMHIARIRQANKRDECIYD